MPVINIRAAISYFWFILLIFFGCSDPSENQYNYTREGVPDSLLALYNEILAIHDEVMPEMTTLSGYQNSLAEEIRQLKSEPDNNDMVRQLNGILGELNKAEDAMMTWMHSFSRIDSIPGQEMNAFLEKEKISVTEMRNLVQRSLQTAKDYLHQNE